LAPQGTPGNFLRRHRRARGGEGADPHSHGLPLPQARPGEEIRGEEGGRHPPLRSPRDRKDHAGQGRGGGDRRRLLHGPPIRNHEQVGGGIGAEHPASLPGGPGESVLHRLHRRGGSPAPPPGERIPLP
jgi:hypothetical protein